MGRFPVSWHVLDIVPVLVQTFAGDFGRTRTFNLLIRSQMLYPLSYEACFAYSTIPSPLRFPRRPVRKRLQRYGIIE